MTVISVIAAVSIALNVFLLLSGSKSYLETPEQIYIMESGILKNSFEFADGEILSFNMFLITASILSFCPSIIFRKLQGTEQSLKKH